MRAPLFFVATTFALASVGCGSVSSTASEAGIPDIPLPPVIDATFPPDDSAITQDRRTFFCGTISGAVNGRLVCDRLYPDLNWDVDPGSATISIEATAEPADAGPTPVTGGTALGFRIPTPVSDSAGADPLDASADAYDWANLSAEVLSNSFHGTLKATLADADGGMPLYVDMTF